MGTDITNEQIEELARSAAPYSLVVLRWGPNRTGADAAAVELEHQRRMVGLRADGVIAILCPVASDSICGVAIMDTPTAEAERIMQADPCVRAQQMTCDVYECHGFPGDCLPPATTGAP